MAAAARSFQVVKPHVRMIKFPLRGSAASQSNVEASVTTAPTIQSQTINTINRADNSTMTVTDIPARYRRKPIDEIEIGYIMRGGPE